jgi:antitoxin VapB
MTTVTRIFKNGNSQAVRIPLAYDRTDMDVEIERIGDQIVIRPVRRRLDKVMVKFAQFSPDFMADGRGDNEETPRDML